jgi:hypothetical protein
MRMKQILPREEAVTSRRGEVAGKVGRKVNMVQ